MSRASYLVQWADGDDPWTTDLFLNRQAAISYAYETWTAFGIMWVQVIEKSGAASRVIWKDGETR